MINRAARALILQGLGEHFGFVDETANPDLDERMNALSALLDDSTMARLNATGDVSASGCFSDVHARARSVDYGS